MIRLLLVFLLSISQVPAFADPANEVSDSLIYLTPAMSFSAGMGDCSYQIYANVGADVTIKNLEITFQTLIDEDSAAESDHPNQTANVTSVLEIASVGGSNAEIYAAGLIEFPCENNGEFKIIEATGIVNGKQLNIIENIDFYDVPKFTLSKISSPTSKNPLPQIEPSGGLNSSGHNINSPGKNSQSQTDFLNFDAPKCSDENVRSVLRDLLSEIFAGEVFTEYMRKTGPQTFRLTQHIHNIRTAKSVDQWQALGIPLAMARPMANLASELEKSFLGAQWSFSGARPQTKDEDLKLVSCLSSVTVRSNSTFSGEVLYNVQETEDSQLYVEISSFSASEGSPLLISNLREALVRAYEPFSDKAPKTLKENPGEVASEAKPPITTKATEFAQTEMQGESDLGPVERDQENVTTTAIRTTGASVSRVGANSPGVAQQAITKIPMATEQGVTNDRSINSEEPISTPSPSFRETARISDDDLCDSKELGSEAQSECLRTLLVREDARLNDAYKRVVKTVSDSERLSLRDRQRKWITSRDAECASQRNEAMPSLHATAHSKCVLRLTIERANQLNDIRRP
jgi:uncharacterized protein YecT (DUF1311 family)